VHLSEEHWSVNPILSPRSELISGEQSLKRIGAHICIEVQPFIKSYSSYNKLVFITAYVKPFIYNTRHKKADRLAGPIQVSEFPQALFALVRMV